MNNNNQNIPKVSKRNLPLLVLIIIIFIFLSGSTVAYLFTTASNTIFTGNLSNVDLSLNVTKVLPNTNGMDDIFVIGFDELASSINADCYDDGYTLCQIYKITLSNSANGINTDVRGRLSFDNENAPNLSWLYLGNSFSTSTTYTSAMLGNSFNTASSTFTNFIDSYLINAGTSKDFYVVVWVNESEVEQNDEGVFTATVRFDDSNGKGVTATFS